MPRGKPSTCDGSGSGCFLATEGIEAWRALGGAGFLRTCLRLGLGSSLLLPPRAQSLRYSPIGTCLPSTTLPMALAVLPGLPPRLKQVLTMTVQLPETSLSLALGLSEGNPSTSSGFTFAPPWRFCSGSYIYNYRTESLNLQVLLIVFQMILFDQSALRDERI